MSLPISVFIIALNTVFLRTLRIAKILERQEQMEREGMQRKKTARKAEPQDQ